MKQASYGCKAGICGILFFSSMLLFAYAASAADAPPSISVSVSPANAGLGDTITVTATANDDLGVKTIYFYPPGGGSLVQDCAGVKPCTKSITQIVNTLGVFSFCAKALDTSNQLSPNKCADVTVTTDRAPIIKYFHTEPREDVVATVSIEGTVKFTIVAEDDSAVAKIFFKDVSAGYTESHDCGNLKSCIFETKRTFNSLGVYTFCTWAIDDAGKSSTESCIDVHVITKYSCEMITVDDLNSIVPVAMKLTTTRLHPEKDGLSGYSAQCCKEMGYCNDIKINTTNCVKLEGDLPNTEYNVLNWDPNIQTLKDLLSSYSYPQVLCTASLGSFTAVGVIDNKGYSAVGEVQNLEDDWIKYWLVGAPGASALKASSMLVYTSGGGGSEVSALKDLLKNAGYPAEVLDRSTPLTKEMLSSYGQVWLIQTAQSSPLTQDEVNALKDYHNNGGNLLLSGGGASGSPGSYVDMVGDIAKIFGVTYESPSSTGTAGCSNLNTQVHSVTNSVGRLSSTGSDAMISSTNPEVKIVASLVSSPFVMILDSANGKGRVAFDTSPARFLSNAAGNEGGLDACDNSKYIGDLVKWLDGGVSQQQIADAGSVDRKYFFAEQLQKEENETKVTTIVDAQKYSDAVYNLMKDECTEKDLESGECQFDMNPPETLLCNPGAPCGSGACIGCPLKKICEACAECHKVMSYTECTYQKYMAMYGRPYVDYLYCWRIPGLKDTPWCYQKADQPTSTVNYPWYGFTRMDNGYYRTLQSISDEYIDEINKWNTNVDVKEMPEKSGIEVKEWVPESYCTHNYDDKLFRNIWTKIFTVTPFLNDLRNNMTWTKTGPGAVYAGGGFRREPACWWEDCRRCAPFSDCACNNGCGGQICCQMAKFVPTSVHNIMEIDVPYTTVADGGMTITYNADNTEATIDNGAVNVISTGNEPFEVSASFSKDETKGTYILTIDYTPIGGFSGNMEHNPARDQFIIAQDIILKYNLNEDAPTLMPGIKETFSTSLKDKVCNCFPIPPGGCPAGCGQGACCCCPTKTVTVDTEESIEDLRGSRSAIDTIKIEALKVAANGFVDLATTKGWMVGLVSYSEHPTCNAAICDWHALTKDPVPLHAQIDAYIPHTGTCMSCGINKAIPLFSAAQAGEKHIIVMSDGVPQCCLAAGGYQCSGSSQADIETQGKNEALAEARRACAAGIKVHTVLMGTAGRGETDPQFMKDLAVAGCGQSFEVTCECGLECIYKKLVGAPIVKDNVVLVNDVTGSMAEELQLECPGTGTPVIHQFGAINITINGNIDNYLDSRITTGVRSKGQLNIYANPDIISRMTLNVDESSVDYYSLVYPVKHNTFRTFFAHGSWHPGYPYVYDPMESAQYEPKKGTDTLTFDTAYGYETQDYNYPDQCNQLCPSDCRCPANDITDVTCTDENGKDYKRTDCVCLPAAGQSYMSPCTSQRNFHEEEGYYYDFVDLETKEVAGDINLMGQLGTNPQFTGNLQGEVSRTAHKELVNTSYIFIANSDDNTVSKVRTSDCKELCRYNVGSNPSRTTVDLKGYVWVGNRNSADVTKLKSDSCEVVGTYKAGDTPRALAVDADNNVWVGCSGSDNDVWKFDGTTGNCLIGDPAKNPTCPAGSKPIKLGGTGYCPYGAVYDCRGYVWMVCSVDQGKLFKIDTKTGTLVSPAAGWDVGGTTYGIGLDYNGDIWLGGAGSGNVYKVKGTDGSVLCKKTLGGMTRGVAVDMDGNAWVADSMAGQVVKVDGNDCSVLGKYTVGTTPIGVGIDFDGMIWSVNQGSNDATKLDTSGNKLCTAMVGKGPYTYSDMSGYNRWWICDGKKLTYPYVKESNGSYFMNFQALNFPYSLLKYQGQTWFDRTVAVTDCAQICKDRGLVTSENCTCPAGLAKACVYCKKDPSAVDNDYCFADCKAPCPSDFNVSQCCCSQPSFKTSNASLTVYIHFRDDKTDQTFNLFPPRTEKKPYAVVNINVTVRDPAQVICRVSPTNTGPNQEITVQAKLIDALTGKGIPSEDVTIRVEGYGLSETKKTDSNGNRPAFKFGVHNENTKVSCTFAGNQKYTEYTDSSYVNVYTTDKLWWFLSPEVLLLVIVIAALAFSYKWFRGGRLDLHSLWDELRGKK